MFYHLSEIPATDLYLNTSEEPIKNPGQSFYFPIDTRSFLDLSEGRKYI